jgi:hypothetical protein
MPEADKTISIGGLKAMAARMFGNPVKAVAR